MKNFGLTGKSIFLTGASGYLGSHLHKALSAEGAHVAAVDVNATGGVSVLDITNKKDLEDYAALYISLNGGRKINGIVNNAAISFKSDDLTTEQFAKTMEINVTSVYNIIKAFEPILDENASIVNVASLYGFLVPNFKIYDGDQSLYSSSAYNCSKGALIQMTKYYAAKLAPIRVNAVSPGGIYQGHTEEFNKMYSDRVPLKRMALPEEIVNVVLFLLSPLSSYITGANIPVTGGIEIW